MSPLHKKSLNGQSATLRNYVIASGVIAFAIMIFTYFCHSNSLLFGDNTVLRMDLYHQYGPLYSELYDRVVNGYSLVYSWTSGLGGGFLGNLFNYCCSPFALVMLIFGHKNMPEAIAVMFLLKAMAASMTFTYYINKSNKTVNKISIAFGLCYAFCSYFVAYSWNIMWIDAMVMFPLVILGIERIIQDKKPSLFIFALTYTMITNYYMAYMVCILSVIYFLYYFFGRYELKSRLSASKQKKDDDILPVTPFDNSAADEVKVNTYAAEAATDTVVSTSDLPFEEIDSAPNDEAVASVNEAAPSAEVLPSDNEALPVNEPSAEVIDASQPLAQAEEVITQIDDYMAKEGSTDKAVAPEEAQNSSPDVEIEKQQDNGFCFTPEALHNTQNSSNDASKSKNKPKKDKSKGLLRDNRFWATGWTFALSAVLCFLISAFALLPVVFCLQTSSATSASFPSDFKTYFNIFDFAANHLPSLETTIRSSGSDVLPNIYCGLLTLMLIPFYFLSGKISGKKKIAAVVIIGVFYASFSVNYLNFIWHGFHFPNDLPYRFSFAYSFILLTLAYKAIENISEFSRRAFIITGMVFVGGGVLLTKIGSKNVDSYSIALTIIFAILYVIVFGMFTSKTYVKKTVTSLLIFTVAVELCFANTPRYTMAQPKSSYTGDYDSYREISQLVDDNDNDLFYRTELSKLRTRMDPCWYGYNGVSTFSSMAYEHVAKLMDSVGLFGNNINSYTYYPQTPVFNSMFSLKYIYDNEDLINNDNVYTAVAANDTYDVYRNKYYLPLAFSVNEAVAAWDTSSSNPFDVQNNFVQDAVGVDTVMQGVDATDVSVTNLNSVSISSVNSGSNFHVEKIANDEEAEVIVTVEVAQEGDYYVYLGSTALSSVKITADGFSYSYASSAIQPFTINVGNQPVGAKISVVYTIPKDKTSANVTFKAAQCDLAKFDTAFKAIEKNGTIQLTEFNESSFAGTINVTNDDALLYTSVPYDVSWQITVDGKVLSYAADDAADTEGSIVKIGKALIGIDLEKGSHTIEFKYIPRGLSTGIITSCLGLAVLAFLLLYKFVISKKLAAKGKKTTVFNIPEKNNY